MLLRACAITALAALFLSSGCALTDRLSGVSEAKAIRKIGVPAQATVLAIWDTGITVNDDPVIGLRVTVAREGHPPYDAVIEKSLVSRVHIPQFQPGARIPVKVDPGNPLRVAIDVYKQN